MLLKNWDIAPETPMSVLREFDMHPILAQVLYNRGFIQPADAHHFLYDRELALDPFQMKDMARAVGRIIHAIRKGERIAVYGDFDADGVTATTLLIHVLHKLNANAGAYIPHRVDEGYGLNSRALRHIAKQGATLVITVDCGIRSVQEVEDAKAAGLDMIITDHHSLGPELPDAYAVVNPQQEDCAGDDRIAGVGVAFMLAYALLKKKLESAGRENYPAIRVSDLLDLVAIGTVADVMKLNAPLNRQLVYHGLKTINEQRRPGLKALMDVADVKAGEADAMSIGFRLGPRINAAGRLESAMLAYQLLSAPDMEHAQPLAAQLQDLNKQRQQLTRDSEQRIAAQMETAGEYDAPLLFAVDDEIQQGIVGLVAGRLKEAYYRPAIVLERGAEYSHASCRSIPEFHITRALDDCADLLARHGGHAMAAGFTIKNENIPALRERMMALTESALAGETLVPTVEIDMELGMHQLSIQLAEELRALEPTGNANQQPIFVTRNLNVMDKRTVGGDNSHLKLSLTTDGEPPIDAIGFRMGELLSELPNCVDAAYCLEINEWQGRRNIQLNLQDIRPAEA